VNTHAVRTIDSEAPTAISRAEAREGRLDVLFLVPSLQGGGAERVMVTLCRHLDRTRFRPVLAVIDMTDAVYASDVPADVELVDLKSRRVRNALPRIVTLIWRRRPHVVFSTLGQLNLGVALLRQVLPRGTRYVAREASIMSLLPSLYSLPRWWFWAYRRLYRRFDVVVCQSRAMQADLVDNFGLASQKTVVINNPLDVERIRALSNEAIDSQADEAQGGMRLVAAGSLIPVKGFNVLIEAMALLKHTNFHLTILGDGPQRHELESKVRAHGLQPKIRFAGFCKNPYPFFRRADAFVLTSRFEGFPNVVLEALACGTPVVALPGGGGILEIVGNVAGCAVADDNTAPALSRAIQQIKAGTRVQPDAVRRYSVPETLHEFETVFSSEARRV
jgi:glycosyltransferase involved in cell wall biosynthesis